MTAKYRVVVHISVWSLDLWTKLEPALCCVWRHRLSVCTLCRVRSYQLMDMLAALEEEDPEMMQQMLEELMKDPAFAEVSTSVRVGGVLGETYDTWRFFTDLVHNSSRVCWVS